MSSNGVDITRFDREATGMAESLSSMLAGLSQRLISPISQFEECAPCITEKLTSKRSGLWMIPLERYHIAAAVRAPGFDQRVPCYLPARIELTDILWKPFLRLISQHGVAHKRPQCFRFLSMHLRSIPLSGKFDQARGGDFLN
ncbi:hypothetical protein PPS11_02134 [Pseudomonas putida S11]|nr:hypothetical protein PPS11_02134 [Pseudomonas putida S11]